MVNFLRKVTVSCGFWGDCTSTVLQSGGQLDMPIMNKRPNVCIKAISLSSLLEGRCKHQNPTREEGRYTHT